MSQLLEHLRLQLEDQVAALQQRRQQLRATLQEDVESASVQVQNQYQVLDNLRYEAEVLTEKLMKLRSSRQDIEAELFVLKDKRIRLLDVIGKLEDEEMQLVSEVGGSRGPGSTSRPRPAADAPLPLPPAAALLRAGEQHSAPQTQPAEGNPVL